MTIMRQMRKRRAQERANRRRKLSGEEVLTLLILGSCALVSGVLVWVALCLLVQGLR